LIPIILFILFFWWTRKKYKQLKAAANMLANDTYLLFIKKSRIISALVISLSIFPLFDVYAPWFYLLINQCIILGSVIYLFWQKNLKPLVFHCLFLFIMLIAISVNNSFEPGIGQRCLLIGLNLVSIGSAFFLFPKIKLLPTLKRTIRIIAIIYMAVNLLAIACNVFGRVIIAEAFTNAGIIGIIQIIALSVFLQILSEGFYLQLISSRIKRNIKITTDYQSVLKALNRPLLVFILLIWAMMFFANLYMYEMLQKGVIRLFTSAINIGSLSFTIGNVVLFFVIIWIAHLMQKYIGSFFGDADGDEDVENKKGRSRMMVVKLIVLCIGYLLAVAVSGLPVDKITIVIGALGVGVGMGLQSIVNNFVSGVVLIFDRPLQIGDFIEVGENSGKVKNIGIRSSTLLTADGAEVIIPNGDILSRPITNWTLSNNERRIELNFILQAAQEKEVIIQMIKETIRSVKEVVAEKEPIVLFESMKENEMEIKIFFWCNNANKSDWLKSEIRYLLYGKFRENKITVL
jgi:potassium efflux system protein